LAFILFMLGLDLYAFGAGRAHRVSTREALAWSSLWIVLALSFNMLLWVYLHDTAGTAIADARSLEFFTGYLLEKSLSVDNMFIFLMIFNFFAVPVEYQRRVLVFGVLGAIVLRTIVILFGSWLLREFHWILYFFGIFLVFTGIKMLVFANKEADLNDNYLLNWLKKHLPLTKEFVKEKFIVFQEGKWIFTPLFLVLVLIEVSDLIFAVDSVPAVFAVTSDPFIVWTSNIFAILGLRALFFLLSNMADRFHLLKYGLAVILAFIGLKMLIVDIYPIPISIALLFVGIVLTLSVVGSLYIKPKR
ncbi:MAG: TerC family protein, partial [Gammaproteobacteria bacterium]|nr:TerC family protein [Gammaproteobacteria bacterium]